MKGITLWGVYENGDITSGATSKDSRDTDKGNTVQAVRKMSQAKNLWKDKAVTRIYRKRKSAATDNRFLGIPRFTRRYKDYYEKCLEHILNPKEGNDFCFIES